MDLLKYKNPLMHATNKLWLYFYNKYERNMNVRMHRGL